MSKPTLFVVDDQPENLELIREVFQDEFEVHTAGNGHEALENIPKANPRLIILDVMMPKMDGFQVCLRLRQMEELKNTPIIFLTSKTEPEAEVFGLDLGANDFVIKPFNKDVLKARVRKQLDEAAADTLSDTIWFDDFEINWDRHEVVHTGDTTPLTTKEVQLLQLFVQNKGKVLSRGTILEKIWADTYITDRTIDSHIKEIRKKIPPLIRRIKTVYGSGYRMDD
ncbi:MAG: response regulator transcription factor [Deltaproteobacteria bacterium]|nr:response regulator transcription factor [Deltaproteobacteria bacterium]